MNLRDFKDLAAQDLHGFSSGLAETRCHDLLHTLLSQALNDLVTAGAALLMTRDERKLIPPILRYINKLSLVIS